jgi:hypothetical protein
VGVSFNALPASQPQLKIVSSDFNPTSHILTVGVLNQSAKMIVAYVTDVRAFDVSHKPVGLPLIVGTDNVFTLVYGADSPAASLLAPTAKMTKQFGPFSPDVVTTTASVVSVVYLDRTAEGDPKQTALVFKTRKLRADHAESLAQLLATYPASPDELAPRLSKIEAISERVDAIEPLLRSGGSTNQKQWKEAAAKQKALADLLTSYTKAVE